MPLPIICLDAELRHYAEEFRSELPKPQYQHFVTVRLRLMQCEGASESSLSRFCPRHHRRQGARESAATRASGGRCRPWWQPNKSGNGKRPKIPVVTGYLIGDDSTMHKRKGKKMEG